MKKTVLVLMSLMISVSAFARPSGGGHYNEKRFRPRHHHYSPAPRNTIIYKNRNSGPDWLGPALIIGATTALIVSANSQPRHTEVIVRERSESKSIREELRGASSYSWDQAQENWFNACAQWKRDLNNEYSSVDAACGKMTCVNNGKNYCYSQAKADVERIVRY